MARVVKEKRDEVIEILRLQKATFKLYLIGTTALWMNRLSKKAREQLLLPSRRLNQAAREATDKHNPPEEFRDSIYRCRDPKAPTLVHMPNGAFKGALASCALRLPGATKAEIGQLVSVVDPTVFVWGIPYLAMSPVRNSDPKHTPDIRTRAVFPEWACMITVSHVNNLITGQNVANLAGGAGMIVGVGDGRVEKGKFDYGQWEIVSPDDKRWKAIVAKQGRRAQEYAMANPVAYDLDTEELLAFYHTKIKEREREPARPSRKPSMAVIAASRASNGRGRGRRAAA